MWLFLHRFFFSTSQHSISGLVGLCHLQIFIYHSSQLSASRQGYPRICFRTHWLLAIAHGWVCRCKVIPRVKHHSMSPTHCVRQETPLTCMLIKHNIDNCSHWWRAMKILCSKGFQGVDIIHVLDEWGITWHTVFTCGYFHVKTFCSLYCSWICGCKASPGNILLIYTPWLPFCCL